MLSILYQQGARWAIRQVALTKSAIAIIVKYSEGPDKDKMWEEMGS